MTDPTPMPQAPQPPTPPDETDGTCRPAGPALDQREPEYRSPTGAPVSADPGARGPRGEALTTAQGLVQRDTDHALKAGPRGPTLLQDIHFREKITHFDHERIPERVVHARGAGAHGVFRANGAAAQLTRAKFLQPDAETPVFVRFSTVVGSRGSADTVRDTRGFATKFYTEEGVYDLVGNNIPVFFIQEAIKFPDVIHAAKPHPDREIPQAQTAHDTFWDFVTLHSEATMHTFWAMSDRALPRSFRMMEGFGVHTFRFVNADGETSLVKFHWKPRLGVHSMLWEETQMAAGFDPDFHRRDLAEAIEAGAFPEWDLGIQVFPDSPEHTFEGIDLLDPTKIVPEEMAPVQIIGTLQLNANPVNFFAETEQVAFCVSHLVPGIEVTDDPLLQGRLFSYLDTQLLRLGGPNFSQLPINRPHSPVNDNFRDGFHQTGVHPGVAVYKPNSTGGGCPFTAAVADRAYVESPTPIPAPSYKLRTTATTDCPVSFADHYSQPRMFYRSLTPIEQRHLGEAFAFELGKCTDESIRQRGVKMLAEVDTDLAGFVATQLGLPVPEPEATVVELLPSPALSQLRGSFPVDGRKVAIVADDAVDHESLDALVRAFQRAKTSPMVVAPHGGNIDHQSGIPVDRTFATMRSIEFDAAIFLTPASDYRVDLLVSEMWRHGKPLAATGPGEEALKRNGIGPDRPGVFTPETLEATTNEVLEALATHRVWARFA
ncbi:catalase [Nocardia transvalensis]|uniref:catalase n=1 Tax=Nocardia transvalensis TaxID=37333 RepID=UPI001895F3AA|nr:catalase [Nocardia transvalensis]MBF6330604.1 catalase [Nocardia transvalensis]